jgi:RecJ-like exonuclease
MPIVKSAGDMAQMFSAKTAPDRVASRYDAAKDIAITKYINYATPFRMLVERVREVLTDLGVPQGRWGVHIAFAEVLLRLARATKGRLPDAVVAGVKSEYVAKGADPAVLDKIATLVVS